MPSRAQPGPPGFEARSFTGTGGHTPASNKALQRTGLQWRSNQGLCILATNPALRAVSLRQARPLSAMSVGRRDGMRVDETDEDRSYRTAAAKYRASHMSNSKWLRFFRAVIDAEVDLPRVRWSFIDSDHSIWVRFPSARDLLPNRFADGRFQPFEYRWIETVFIPHAYRPEPSVGFERAQDTAAVQRAVSAAGQFPLYKSEEGVELIAYAR